MKFEAVKRKDGGTDYIGDCGKVCYSINKEGMGLSEQCPLLEVPEMECEDSCKD